MRERTFAASFCFAEGTHAHVKAESPDPRFLMA